MHMKKLLRAGFLLYGILMLWLLFDRSGTTGAPYWQQVADNLNLNPFHTIGNYADILLRPEYYLEKWEAAAIYFWQARHAVINLAGNVVMFVPLGFFVPGVWEKCRGFFRTLLCAAGMITAVELTQLFSLRGSCDVDDLILNLVGVAVGYGLFRLTAKR